MFVFPRRFGYVPPCTVSLDEGKGNLAETSWKNKFQLVCCVIVIFKSGDGL